jgi:hypothetical protein
MSPRRNRPVSSREAALGMLAMVLAVAGIVGLSYALLVPAQVERELPAPVEPVDDDEDLVAGLPVCPDDAPTPIGDEPIAVTSVELVECPDLFDGRRVTYGGEAVGAVMRKGSIAWLHVNDDLYGLTLGPLPTHRLTVGGNAGMAVVAPSSAVEGITTGSFNRHGTGLAITGTYRKNHPADPGSPAIHAETLEIVRQPLPVEHPVSLARLLVAIALAALTLTLTVVWRRTR